jgi:transcription elongation factor GreA
MKEISKIGARRLQIELEQIESQLPEVGKEVETARGFGDYSENDELAAALAKFTTMSRRKTEIEFTLSSSTVKQSYSNNIAAGSLISVEIIGPESARKELGLLLFDEKGSAVFDGTISPYSPLGRVIQGGTGGDYKVKGPTGVDFVYRVQLESEDRIEEYLAKYPTDREITEKLIFQ